MDSKIKFKYLYNAGLALCLLQAAFLAITFYATLGWAGPIIDDFNFMWWGLFFIWPLWLVALVIFWFYGDRKIWRLLVPLGLGFAFIAGVVLFIVWLAWALGHGSMG